jgi:probable phosphomutase (TIGR03848 family)
VPTVLLVRHGRTAANADGTLAGRMPGVRLDETGRGQAAALAARLAPLPLVAVLTSPLERCVETAEALLATGGTAAVPRPVCTVDDGLAECDYGEWTGQALKKLVKDPLWPVVQAQPSAAVFPGGESMRAVQQRAVDSVRCLDARVDAEHGPDALWLAVSHGDVIKSVLADALGVHLDSFQRIVVDPCSVSAIRYTPLRPFVLRCNDSGDLRSLVPPPRKRRRRTGRVSSDAAVGGGAGGAASTSVAG